MQYALVSARCLVQTLIRRRQWRSPLQVRETRSRLPSRPENSGPIACEALGPARARAVLPAVDCRDSRLLTQPTNLALSQSDSGRTLDTERVERRRAKVRRRRGYQW